MFNFMNDSTVSAHSAYGGTSLNMATPKVTVAYSENWYVFILPY